MFVLCIALWLLNVFMCCPFRRLIVFSGSLSSCFVDPVISLLGKRELAALVSFGLWLAVMICLLFHLVPLVLVYIDPGQPLYYFPQEVCFGRHTHFIANSSLCITTELSKLSTSCLIVIKNHAIKYCEKSFNDRVIWAPDHLKTRIKKNKLKPPMYIRPRLVKTIQRISIMRMIW